jgi:hypothetical protein
MIVKSSSGGMARSGYGWTPRVRITVLEPACSGSCVVSAPRGIPWAPNGKTLYFLSASTNFSNRDNNAYQRDIYGKGL